MALTRSDFKPRLPAESPPASVDELMSRAKALAGVTVGELGTRYHARVPQDQRHAKGLVGQLVEHALGADAGNLDEPDFRGLSIELKTIPLDINGKPKESTYVCSISLSQIGETEWRESVVWRKLKHVLFVPVESDKEVVLADRRFGHAKLWRPNEDEEELLRTDWEAHAVAIARGEVEELTGHAGTVLQVRPKAKDSTARRRAPQGEDGFAWVNPKGFYLRPSFTKTIVAR